MSVILNQSALRRAVSEQSFIKGGEETCAEGLKYDFRLGTRILMPGRQPIDLSLLPEGEKKAQTIGPGEMVFVLSQETVDLPIDMKAELSPKRKLSHAGLSVLAGLCIDPGYAGHLLISLCNLSSIPYPIAPGKKLIAAQFYRLDEEETSPDAKKPEPINDFPAELVRMMVDYRPVSVESLRAAFDQLTRSVGELRTELHSKEEWFKRFQGLMDRLGADLEKEATNRSETEREFRKTLQEIQGRTAKTAALVALIAALVVAVVAGIVQSYIQPSLQQAQPAITQPAEPVQPAITTPEQ